MHCSKDQGGGSGDDGGGGGADNHSVRIVKDSISSALIFS